MPSTDRATCWSVTLNMKNVKQQTCLDMIESARSTGWKVDGQLEKGEKEGTEHYQLMVRTPQVRFSAVKKMFPTAHIEVARNSKALEKYVNKADTRIAALPEADDRYVSATRLWDMIYQEYNRDRDKDGWNVDSDEVEFYRFEEQASIEKDPLAFFDKVMGSFIRRGYYVDMLVVNPAVRSLWKKFWRDILYRSRETDRQTDRQTVNISEIDSITDASNSRRGDTSSCTREEDEEEPYSDGSCDEESEGDSSEGWDEGLNSQADESDDGSGSGE